VKKCQRDDEAFLKWLHEHYFDSSFSSPIRGLHALGADYHYLDFLIHCLAWWYKLEDDSRKACAKPPPPIKKTDDDWFEEHRADFQFYGEMARINENFANTEPGEFYNPNPAWDMLRVVALGALEAEEEKREKNLIESYAQFEKRWRRDPLFRLYAGYAPTLNKPGTPDPFGSLFLLAITEHVNKNKRSGNSSHLLAFKLLQACREVMGRENKPIKISKKRDRENKTAKTSETYRTRATARVSQLKKSKSAEWPTHIELLGKFFLQSYRPDTPTEDFKTLFPRTR